LAKIDHHTITSISNQQMNEGGEIVT